MVLMIPVSRPALPGAESIPGQTVKQTDILGYYNIDEDDYNFREKVLSPPKVFVKIEISQKIIVKIFRECHKT